MSFKTYPKFIQLFRCRVMYSIIVIKELGGNERSE